MKKNKKGAHVPQGILDDHQPSDFSLDLEIKAARKRFKLKPGEGPR